MSKMSLGSALAVVATTALVAGCGGGSDNEKTSTTKTTAQTTTVPSARTSTTPTPAPTPKPKPAGKGETAPAATPPPATPPPATPASPDIASGPAVKQAVKACKKNAAAGAQLKANGRKALRALCAAYESGNKDRIRKAGRDLCLSIITDTGVKGAAANTAKKQCDAISG
jgi:hypothetical protein